MITNTHASNDATVSIFIQDNPSDAASTTFYIIHTIAVPADCSLLLDNPSVLSINNNASGYGLFAEVGSSDTVDILIN